MLSLDSPPAELTRSIVLQTGGLVPRAPTQSPDLLEGFGCGSRPSVRSSADTELRTEAEAPRGIGDRRCLCLNNLQHPLVSIRGAPRSVLLFHPSLLLPFTQR